MDYPNMNAAAASSSSSSSSSSRVRFERDASAFQRSPEGSLLFSPMPSAENALFSHSHESLSVDHKQELTHSPLRVQQSPTRLPIHTVPSPSAYSPATPTTFAISNHYNPTYSYSGQDVHSIVNVRVTPHSRTGLSSSAPLETPVSSFSQPSSQYAVNNSSNRLRTPAQVFTSTQDLVAHYGIPSILPPPPRTKPTTSSTPVSAQPQPYLSDFESMKNSYLSMLNSTNNDNSTSPTSIASSSTAPQAPLPSSMTASQNVESADPQALGLGQEDLENLVSFFSMDSPLSASSLSDQSSVSPGMADPSNQSFLTSPPSTAPEMLDSFDSPLDDTPFSDFLSTPLIDFGDDSSGSPSFFDGASLFPEMAMYNPPSATIAEKQLQPQPEFEGLYTISPQDSVMDNFPATPATPAMHTFPSTSPAHKSTALPSVASNPMRATATGRRKSTATGTRKGLTPAALVPEDAPTQPRKYVMPSATSRKEVPVTFSRKRARSQAFGEEDDDELQEELPPDATEKEQIEWKRRQNTIAARRSRKRKLEHQQHLENEVDRLNGEVNKWRDRSMLMQSMLKAQGVEFSFDS